MIRPLYRKLMPLSIRAPLWKVRHFVWTIVSFPGRAYRRAKAQLMISIGRPTIPVKVNGFELSVDLRDKGVGFPIYMLRKYEESESAVLRATLKKGMCFVDVGANLGYFTTLASRIVGEQGHVLAIEPDEYNYNLLERNIRSNHVENVTLHKLALGSSTGTAMLSRSPTNLGDHRVYGTNGSREQVAVRMETLDNLLSSAGLRPDVVKMDVQGFEYFVVQGMKSTLRDNRLQAVITEFWPHGINESGASPRDFVELMESFGFRATALLDDGTTEEMTSVGTQKTTFERILDLLPSQRKGPNDGEDLWLNLVFHR